ncbi:Histone-lysine N-methyltransferase ATX2 -like protein [Gossypium arboreum]|uniref:Histone-lysine N-methyltransferase ATX2-like protein n=1 Tax=Gossypium arboreum TaxID=29729 RepID=A0A0B0NJ00_GOSAR|nr:Histone-lysine N-methyltransferase ATX2 -like protein [Gossypium arboreum]
MAFPEKGDEEDADTPIRYVSLDRVYSSASLCVSATNSSNVMSKKVKARKLIVDNDHPLKTHNPPVVHVYSRRLKRPRQCVSFYDSLLEGESQKTAIKSEIDESLRKKRRIGSNELANLGIDSSVLCQSDRPRLRDCRNNCSVNNNVNSNSIKKRKHNSTLNSQRGFTASATAKKWVFWPLDADWYLGRVVGYNLETNRHHVEYVDGDEEDLILSNERLKFHVSHEEMERLNLSFSVDSTKDDDHDYDEMVALAASRDDCQELEPGDIIWAKLTGHAMWPAIVVDESLLGDRKGLSKISGGRSVPVQFFGTHDFARIKLKQVVSFLKGLLSSFHRKCKKPRFSRGLEEARLFLCEQKLPRRMLQLQNGIVVDGGEASSEDEGGKDSIDDHLKKDQGIQITLGGHGGSSYVIGDLQIINLGKVVKDSEYFQDDGIIWPEGYTAVRKFTSVKDPSVCTLYRMEVLRDPQSKNHPLFRVTSDEEKHLIYILVFPQFEGPDPSACWNMIYERIRKRHNDSSDCKAGKGRLFEPGADMFGFSNPEVTKLIQGLSKSRLSSKFSAFKLASGRFRDLPAGYRPVRVDWKDLDKCSVCHMDEEYENNLFLQCDKCRMMVHARCYGELEPLDGILWLCNLCRPGAPESPPSCCLCPVIGGAMKPTTDGRWAHLACAIWIPETCLSDVKRMEPIDGLNRISKDRWKLLCSICGVSYGACIQCSNPTCRVAYHPLCARAAGLCVELEDEDRLFLLSVDEDDEDQCIRLLSFCKKHRQPSNDRVASDERFGRIARRCSDYTPPLNPSGCARTEPYSHFGRRGRKEPEALAAASLKRLFVENQPYLVGGCCQHGMSGSTVPNNRVSGIKFSFSLNKLKAPQLDAPNNILSVAEKYDYMKQTFRKRLAFGKSGIHGFGIFAKHPHRAGDMVIEYTGELVRPSIADRREHFIYNSLVGAGTYLFRIDNERVIDATRAGSIAHLINHSCEPNCYSRVISVHGDEHIIIFAKRDIKRWEELTYDYRFFSIDERLACYCGFPRCRGVVNDTEAEEQVSKILDHAIPFIFGYASQLLDMDALSASEILRTHIEMPCWNLDLWF